MIKNDIDFAFAELMAARAVHHRIGISQQQVGVYRYNLKNNIPISLDTKYRLLLKSGWREPVHSYSPDQMMRFATDWAKAPDATKVLGVEYFLEKWRLKHGL